MCTCASCAYTDSFSGYGLNAAKGGFENWPRGEPAGQRASDAAYASHVRHAWAGAYKTVGFTSGQAPQYPSWCLTNGPIARNATASSWNAGRGRKYVEPQIVETSTVSLIAYARTLRALVRAERTQTRRAA